VGWYRRPFTIPASDKGRRITVEFEGAFQTTTLYCNNFIVGRHESGYAPFQFDITEFINYGGSNVLSVCVDAKLPEGWWYEGGGIYRDVYLVKTAPVHVPWGGVYVQSWFKVDPDGGRSFLEDTPEGPAHLRIQVVAANKGVARTGVKIRTRVLDPEGLMARAASRSDRAVKRPPPWRPRCAARGSGRWKSRSSIPPWLNWRPRGGLWTGSSSPSVCARSAMMRTSGFS
jgi:beta-galactosidase